MATVPILCLLAVIGMLSPSSMANQYRNSLKSGEILKATEALHSGDYSFIMQPNCNLVLYHDSTAVWSTGTGGKDNSCYAKLLRGGNLVVYSPKNVTLWESITGAPGLEYVLVLQKDGKAVIYGPARAALGWPRENITDQWLVTLEPTNILYSSERLKTDESLILGSYNCTMQTDCNFACRNGTTYVWSSGTAGRGSECSLELDYNGKFTIYDRANATVWLPFNGWDDGNYVLIIQTSPMLCVYGPKLWSTKLNSLTSNSTAQIKSVTAKSPW